MEMTNLIQQEKPWGEVTDEELRNEFEQACRDLAVRMGKDQEAYIRERWKLLRKDRELNGIKAKFKEKTNNL